MQSSFHKILKLSYLSDTCK